MDPRIATINGHDIVIRAFERADAAAVASFSKRLPQHDLLFLDRDIQHPAVIEAWWKAVDRGEIESLVALKGDTVIATTAIVRDPLSWSPHVAEIRVLVAPEARERGLGRILIEESVKVAWQHGALKLIAKMTPGQSNAVALFKTIGFHSEGVLKNHVRDREGKLHDLVMFSMLRDGTLTESAL